MVKKTFKVKVRRIRCAFCGRPRYVKRAPGRPPSYCNDECAAHARAEAELGRFHSLRDAGLCPRCKQDAPSVKS